MDRIHLKINLHGCCLLPTNAGSILSKSTTSPGLVDEVVDSGFAVTSEGPIESGGRAGMGNCGAAVLQQRDGCRRARCITTNRKHCFHEWKRFKWFKVQGSRLKVLGLVKKICTGKSALVCYDAYLADPLICTGAMNECST